MRTRLLIGSAAALAILLPAGAQASPGFHAYKVTIKGEQTTQWSYAGIASAPCQTPEDGKGEQIFTFRSARPVKGYAARAGGRGKWSFTASMPVKAAGHRTGEHTLWHSRSTGDLCQDADFREPAGDCGEKQWRLTVNANYGLVAGARSRMDVWSTIPAGDFPFDVCPWFEGPADSSYWDQNADDKRHMPASQDMMAGLRYVWQDVSQKAWRSGRSFDVSRKLTKPYLYEDQWGKLTGQTTIRWTVHLRRAKL